MEIGLVMMPRVLSRYSRIEIDMGVTVRYIRAGQSGGQHDI